MKSLGNIIIVITNLSNVWGMISVKKGIRGFCVRNVIIRWGITSLYPKHVLNAVLILLLLFLWVLL